MAKATHGVELRFTFKYVEAGFTWKVFDDGTFSGRASINKISAYPFPEIAKLESFEFNDLKASELLELMWCIAGRGYFLSTGSTPANGNSTLDQYKSHHSFSKL